MTLRNLSPPTQASYIHAVKKFSLFFHRSPADLGIEDVRAYQVHLVEQKIAWATLNQLAGSRRGPRLPHRPDDCLCDRHAHGGSAGTAHRAHRECARVDPRRTGQGTQGSLCDAVASSAGEAARSLEDRTPELLVLLARRSAASYSTSCPTASSASATTASSPTASARPSSPSSASCSTWSHRLPIDQATNRRPADSTKRRCLPLLRRRHDHHQGLARSSLALRTEVRQLMSQPECAPRPQAVPAPQRPTARKTTVRPGLILSWSLLEPPPQRSAQRAARSSPDPVSRNAVAKRPPRLRSP